jgi:hypothetical protein
VKGIRSVHPCPDPGTHRELDGHLWRLEGREDVENPDHAQWARQVWTCERCHDVSKVFNNPPKVWNVRPVRLRVGKDEWLETDAHVARRCPQEPKKRWWRR